MPTRSAVALRRVAAALVWVALLVATGGCQAPSAIGDRGAAEATRRYLDLIAEGTAETVPRLAAMTAPEDLTAAGSALLAATERPTVLEVGAVRVVAGSTSDDRLAHLVEVPVRYALGGVEHDAMVGLGRAEDADGTDPSVWLVNQPLIGSIGFGQQRYPADRPAPHVGPVRLADGSQQKLYPAVYPVRTRFASYLTSEAVSVTVVAGSTVIAPAQTMRPTAEAAAAVLASLQQRFRRCAEPALECPFLRSPEEADRLAARGLDPWSSTWWLGVSPPPTIELRESDFTATGGRLRLRLTDGRVEDLAFTATGSWVVDIRSLTPAVVDVTVTRLT